MEEDSDVREAEKRKRDAELTADDVCRRHASVSVESPQPARGSNGETREKRMEEEERAKVREAKKRKRDVELTADDVRQRHASVTSAAQ